MKKIYVLILMVLLTAPQAMAAEEAITQKNLAKELQRALREHPELILDVLKEHSETVLDVAQQGSNTRRKRTLEKQWQNDLKQPKEVQIGDRPVRGNLDAPVTIVAFSDFTCPYCEQGAGIIQQLMQTYSGKVNYVFKHMPLSKDDIGYKASEYFIAAGMQDKKLAWKLYDIMFQNREKVLTDGEEYIKKSAETLGLDSAKLRKDIKGKSVAKIINEDLADAKKLNVEGTPYFLVNDIVVKGALPYDLFKDAIALALKQPKKAKSK